MKTGNLLLAAVFLGGALLLSGCKKVEVKESEKSVSDEMPGKTGNEESQQEKEQTPELTVKEGYLTDKPENIHVATDGNGTYIMGDRGIYEISTGNWQQLYTGTDIKGITVWKDWIYFMQHDVQTDMDRLFRMNKDGSNVEMLREDALMSAWVRIYNDVLYYMGDDMQVRGILLDDNGLLSEESDAGAAAFPYKKRNDFAAGISNLSDEVCDPAYSLAYYGGMFVYRPQDELSRTIVFMTNEFERNVASDVKDGPLVAGNGVYYTKQGGEGIYCIDFDENPEKLLCSDPKPNIRFLNYNSENIYYYGSGGEETEERTICQVNTQTGEVRELFQIALNNIGLGTPFDVTEDYVVYRDGESGSLVMRQISQTDNMIPEP